MIAQIRFILVAVLAFLPFFNAGQGLIGYHENFDGDSLVYNPHCIVTIDSNLPGNIWQIGQPQKALFDSAYSAPNALVTDLIDPYPTNIFSTIEFALTKPEWAAELCWSSVNLWFAYRIDTDTLKDGFFIETSYDGGYSWSNVANDTIPDGISNDFYSISPMLGVYDTLYDGTPGVSGTSHFWWNDTIPWTDGSVELFWDEENGFKVDSCRIRISFISDSIESYKDGVLIDYLHILVSNYCGIGINEISTKYCEIEVHPNPVSSNSFIKIPLNIKEEKVIMEIFDLMGNCVSITEHTTNLIPFTTTSLNNGLYFISVRVGNIKLPVKKVIINN